MDSNDSSSQMIDPPVITSSRLKLKSFGLDIPGTFSEGEISIADRAISLLRNFQLWSARINSLNSSDRIFVGTLINSFWDGEHFTEWERFVVLLRFPHLFLEDKSGAVTLPDPRKEPYIALGCSYILAHKGLLSLSLKIFGDVIASKRMASSCAEACLQSWIESSNFSQLYTFALCSSSHFDTATIELENYLRLCQSFFASKDSNQITSAVEECSEDQLLEPSSLSSSDLYALEGAGDSIGILHHAACSGGTIISQCIAAMHEACLISEVNPFNRYAPDFNPSNPFVMYEKNYGLIPCQAISEAFLRDIAFLQEQSQASRRKLVLRNHTHSEFFSGPPSSMVNTLGITDCLRSHFQILSAVTVRHPLDSFLSLVNNGWDIQFMPNTLDEYCRRYGIFLDKYRESPIFRYEDFCVGPDIFLQRLCAVLRITYCPDYRERLADIQISGNSGRSSHEEIKPRPRRPIDSAMKQQADNSLHYRNLCQRLGYALG